MNTRLSAANRRAQLLVVAVEEFGVHGYHLTTMNGLAEAAGVTKPVLYQHFPSKRELFLAVLDDVGDRLRHAITQAASASSTPREQVEAGFGAYFHFFARQPSSFQLLFGDIARTDEEFAAVAHRVEAALADTIAERMTLGPDARPEDHRTISFGIVGLAEGSCRYWVNNGLPTPPDQLAHRMANLIWYGLRAEGSPKPG